MHRKREGNWSGSRAKAVRRRLGDAEQQIGGSKVRQAPFFFLSPVPGVQRNFCFFVAAPAAGVLQELEQSHPQSGLGARSAAYVIGGPERAARPELPERHCAAV